MAFIAPQVSRRRPTRREGKWGFLEELFQGLAGGGMSLLERRDRLEREAREDERVERGLDLEERRLDRELETEARLAALDRRNAEAAELAAMQNYQTSQDAAFEPFRLEGGADDVREAIENIYGGSGLGTSPEDEEANLAWSRVKEPRTLERTAELVERLGGPLVARDTPEEFLERIGRQEEEQSHVPGLSIHGEFAGPIAPEVAAMPSTAEQLRMVQDTQNETFNRALEAEIDKIEARQMPGMSEYYSAMAAQTQLCMEDPTHPSCQEGQESGSDLMLQELICAMNPDAPGCGDSNDALPSVTDHGVVFTPTYFGERIHPIGGGIYETEGGLKVGAATAALPQFKRLRDEYITAAEELKSKSDELEKWEMDQPTGSASQPVEDLRLELMAERDNAAQVLQGARKGLAELLSFYQLETEDLLTFEASQGLSESQLFGQ